MPVLIAFSARHIQRWILAGGKMRDLAGGSEAVERLTGVILSAVLYRIFGDRKFDFIERAAGRFIVPIDNAAGVLRFLSVWPAVVAEAAPGLASVLVTLPVEKADIAAFQAIRDLRDREGQVQTVRPLKACPLVLPAQRSGLPAVSWERPKDADDDESYEASDAATRRRREFSLTLYRHLEARLLPEGLKGQVIFAKEPEDIAESGKNSTVAYIHADGTRFGDVFFAIQKPLEKRPDGTEIYKAFSKGIKKATEAAMCRTLSRFDEIGPMRKKPEQKKGQNEEILMLRPIVLGGDDMTLVAPGAWGVSVAAVFLEIFEQELVQPYRDLKNALDPETQAALPQRLVAAAGVALVQHHFPARMAYGLSEQLCKWAKTVTRRQTGENRSALAFHRVTTSAIEDYETLLEEELTARDDRMKRLTLGPWQVGGEKDGLLVPLDDLIALLKAKQDKDIPAGAWREIASLLYEPGPAARHRLARLFEIQKARTPDAAKALKDALDRVLGQDCVQDGLWRQRPGGSDPGGFDPGGTDMVATPVLDVSALDAVDHHTLSAMDIASGVSS